jgi:hypothetical protein
VKTEEASRTIIGAAMKARLLAPENRKWLTLAAVTFGLFMIMLDNTIVNVALPSIQRDLGAPSRSSSGS